MGILARAARSVASAFRRQPVDVAAIVAGYSTEQWVTAVALLKHVEAQKRAWRNAGKADREQWQGIEQRQIGVRLRWSPADRERILSAAENGDLWPLALFLDAMRANGVVYGAMRSRSAFLRLPIQWSGDPLLIKWLDGQLPEFDDVTGECVNEGHRSDFQRLFPLSELGAVVWDGDLGGLGIGEFAPEPHTGKIRLRHLDLHWVRMDIPTRSIWYQSPAEQWEIRPGDGRWFVYAPYGLARPWSLAPWLACALPVISMETSILDRLRWQGTLADPLKLIKLEKDRIDKDGADMERFARDDWRRAAYLVLRTDEEAQLVESTGRGYEVYTQAEKASADMINLTLRGQLSTSSDKGGGLPTTGQSGENVEQSIIGETAQKTAESIQEQGLTPYAVARKRRPLVWMKWDTRTAGQKVAEAEALAKHGAGIKAFNEAIAGDGKKLDLDAYIEQNAIGVQLVDLPEEGGAQTSLELAPTSLDTIVKTDQALRNIGLPPSGGREGQTTLAERKAQIDAPATAAASEILVHEERMVAGLPIVIDRPAGTVQRGIGPDGPWTREYLVDYGYIDGTTAPDGDGIDVYLGPSPGAPNAYVIEQHHQDGTFDELKVMLDFMGYELAVGTYLLHVPGWCLGAVHTMPASEVADYLSSASEPLSIAAE